MKIGISLKIDVTKIEKDRLYQGAKGKYLDATIFVDIDQADQYGNNGTITQDVDKAAKDAGVKGPILGNGKVFWNNNQSQSDQKSAPNQTGGVVPNDDGFDSLPF